MSIAKTAAIPQGPEGLKNRVVPVSMGHYNVYFIQTDMGWILVDTGMPGDTKALREAFSRVSVEPQDVRLIIITHAHPDHVGSVAYAKRVTGADVLCHEYAAPFIRAGKSSPTIPHSFLSRLLNAITPSRYRAVEPDIVIADAFDLRDFGIAGQVIHTPGHTQGSLTIVLENGEMILGDLVRGTGTNIHIGSFYEDKEVLVRSLEKLAAYRAIKIYMSHGDSTDHETLRRSIEAISCESDRP